MYISLTNAIPQEKGLPICFKIDNIVSVRQSFVKREGEKASEVVTYIYMPPYGTWEVTEPYDRVLEMLNANPVNKLKKKAV